MINSIFQFEIRRWLKSPIIYVLLSFFIPFTLVAFLGTGGYFAPTESNTENINLLNSPYYLSANMFLFTKMLLLVVVIIAGMSLYTDYRSRMHPILYSFPITKPYFFKGKLGSVLFILLVFCLLMASSIFMGELILGAENPRIDPFNILSYIIAFGIFQIPTILTFAALIFVVVGFSRNIFAGLVAAVCLLMVPLFLNSLLFNHQFALALLDPFGQNAFFMATQEWDVAKKNSTALPVDLWVLFNRMFWLMIGVGAFLFYYQKFDFQFDTIWKIQSIRKSSPKANFISTNRQKNEGLYKALTDYSMTAKARTFLSLIRYHFLDIFQTWTFWLMTGFGLFTVFFIQLKATQTGDFTILPLTRILLDSPLQIYLIISICCTFIFTGYLHEKARKNNMQELIDATPVQNWQLQLSSFGTIGLMQLVQLLLFFIGCLVIQIINSYYQFEFNLYFFHILILIYPSLLLWNITSQFVYSLFPNLFLGLFFLLGLWFLPQLFDQIGLTAYQYKFNTLPQLTYSDFNDYGHSLGRYMLFLTYWMALGIILIVSSSLLWNRGVFSSNKEKWQIANSRITKTKSILLILFGTTFLGLFLQIQNGTFGSSHFSQSELNKALEKYKPIWQKYSHLDQPKIIDINLNIGIYPSKRSFQATGHYTLVNKGVQVLDTILIRTGFDEITQLEWEKKYQVELLQQDTIMRSYLYKLKKPLFSGDSIKLQFNITNSSNSLLSRNSNILRIGSYIRHDILPRLGYQFLKRELPLEDSLANTYNYFHRDADYVNIHTTISTSKDQLAIAPGEMISQSQNNNRKTYEYSSTHPVKLNFSFHSSNFEVLEENHKGINIQLFYHKGHHQNTQPMLDGLKAALDFNTSWFGAYPYKSIRVVEFPHKEAGYSATLTTNNIPTSELVFNINAKAMKDSIQLPFYIMAHELTHEWFGNQLMPADTEGAKMLTESITEYISLCIYKEQFGEDMAAKFLQKQYQRYTNGRKKERVKELPLYKVQTHQEYIAYGKGAIAFNEIAKAVGRNYFNELLATFLKSCKLRSDYFPTTVDFIRFLKNNNPQHSTLIDYWLTETNNIERQYGRSENN